MLKFDETANSEIPYGRYLVLELAGLLDRLDEAAARQSRRPNDNPPHQALLAAIRELTAPGGADRAQRILLMYSDKSIEPISAR